MRLQERPSAIALLGIICSTASASGQTLRPTSAVGKVGGSVSIEVVLQSSSANPQPAAIEWEATIPSIKLQLKDGPLEKAVQLTKHAGKSVTCAFIGNSAQNQILRCVMAGGDKPIPGGAGARLSFRISKKAPAGEAQIRFEHVLAVTRDLKKLPLPDAVAVVMIRGR